MVDAAVQRILFRLGERPRRIQNHPAAGMMGDHHTDIRMVDQKLRHCAGFRIIERIIACAWLFRPPPAGIIAVEIQPPARWSCFKRILKFSLKQPFRHHGVEHAVSFIRPPPAQKTRVFRIRGPCPGFIRNPHPPDYAVLIQILPDDAGLGFA